MTDRTIHNSYWKQRGPNLLNFPPLSADHSTDVLVVGGGITGLSTAIELLERGYRVTVCERSTIASGTTGASSGHLDAHPEMGVQKLIRSFGEEKAREYVSLRLSAIRKIKERAEFGCDFVDVPAYVYSESQHSEENLRRECNAAAQIGLQAEWATTVPLRFANCGYRIPAMARMDSYSYAGKLAKAVIEAGGIIFENTPVFASQTDAGSNAAEFGLAATLKSTGAHLYETLTGSHRSVKSFRAGNHRISFDRAVIAVHCNNTDALRMYLITPPYQSYIIVARVASPGDDALFWSDSDPYYYHRRTSSIDESLILVGGCDHRTGMGNEVESLNNLESYVRSRYEVKEIVSSWSAELFKSSDGLPLIGKVPGKDNIWIAAAFDGTGLTWGTAAAHLLAEQLEGKTIPLEKELSPSRFGIKGAMNTIASQSKTLRNLVEHVVSHEKLEPELLAPGEGKVGNIDGKNVAACRDSAGCLHLHRPVCTHMGGALHWNEVEQTWDCPVHGGRFAADGTCIYGPPQEPLSPATSREEPESSAETPVKSSTRTSRVFFEKTDE